MTLEPDDTVIVPPRAAAPAPTGVDDALTVIRSPGAADADAGFDDEPAAEPVAGPDAEPDTGPGPEPDLDLPPRETGVAAYRVRGETVLLDMPSVIGRRPTAPRIPLSRPPRYVRVPSPDSEVSRTHLSIEHVGPTVVVTDLRSSNGTVVTLPGRAPRTLRPGESIVATAGTLVDIGDGNLITILPVQRALAEDDDATR